MFKAAVLSAVCAACALCQVRTEGAKPVVSVRTGEAGFAVAGVTGAMMGPAGKIAGTDKGPAVDWQIGSSNLRPILAKTPMRLRHGFIALLRRNQFSRLGFRNVCMRREHA